MYLQMPNRYTNVQVTLIRPDEVDPNGYCGEKIVNNDMREAILRPGKQLGFMIQQWIRFLSLGYWKLKLIKACDISVKMRI